MNSAAACVTLDDLAFSMLLVLVLQKASLIEILRLGSQNLARQRDVSYSPFGHDCESPGCDSFFGQTVSSRQGGEDSDS